MVGRSLRFIHSADWHLEQVPYGLTEVPDSLRELLIDCAYRAAQSVIDAVLSEAADFLILSGDILAPRETGVRALTFLQEQFQRLEERRIPVYWAGGQCDRPEELAEYLAPPENVRVFPLGRVGECVYKREGNPVARILGFSREQRESVQAADFPPDGSGMLTIGVAHGVADGDDLARRNFHYWALGGRHERQNLPSALTTAHYPGTPQGRCPAEVGPHGCTLVQIDEHGQVKTSLLTTDVLRWQTETVEITANLSVEDFTRRLRDRAQQILNAGSGAMQLISWRVNGAGTLVSKLRHGTLAGEVVRDLRSQFSQRQPAAWTVDLQVEPNTIWPESWYEQESLLGSFLRTWRRHENQPDAIPDWKRYLPEKLPANSRLSRLELADAEQRGRVLRRAATLGVDLLSGEETRT